MNLRVILLLIFILMLRVGISAQIISTIAGCGLGNDSIATHAELLWPLGVAADSSGNIYIADDASYTVRKINASGVINIFAGTGMAGNSGDGGPATAARMGAPGNVAIDRFGNVLITDYTNGIIRKVNPAGIISTIAGTGVSGYNGDGIPATAAQLNMPFDVAVDTSGNIYVADRLNYRVRKIDRSGIITTCAGTGVDAVAGISGSGPATAEDIGVPFRLTTDQKGNLYIGTYYGWNILKVDTSGMITDFAGTGAHGYSGDGGPATAATFTAPAGLATDSVGNVYFSDIDNERIRMISATTGMITTVAGNGAAGFSGDAGAATGAEISSPEGITFDAYGNLYITDYENNRIRQVTPSGTITTTAGQNGLFGEGIPAFDAEITIPDNLTVDRTGNLYFPDSYNNRVRKIDPVTGAITTVAGSGVSGYEDGFSGDGGLATLAHIRFPSAVAVDVYGNIYIADSYNQRIRVVNVSGNVINLRNFQAYTGL